MSSASVQAIMEKNNYGKTNFYQPQDKRVLLETLDIEVKLETEDSQAKKVTQE